MRGRSTTWTRIRVNLIHVPEADRPPQEALDPDYDPLTEYPESDRAAWLEASNERLAGRSGTKGGRSTQAAADEDAPPTSD